jgi:hypothetical protein
VADNGNNVLDGLYLLAKSVNNKKEQAKEYITSIIGSVSTTWASLTGKPTTFPPDTHTHVVADITDYIAGSLADGDYGDITVSGTGAVLTIDSAVVTEAKQVLADNTTNDVSITKHGYVPKAPNLITQFLRGDASWAALPSAGLTTRSIWLPPSSFANRSGTTLSIVGNQRTTLWSFSGSAANQILHNLRVPDDYASGAMTVKYYWSNAGTSGNPVVWNIIFKELAAGDSINDTAGETSVNETFVPSTTQYALMISTLTQTITPSGPGKFIRLMVQRIATNAADTNTAAMHLEGVEITYTSSI